MMVTIGNILITAGRVCERGSLIAEKSGLKKVFPALSDSFVSVSTKVKKGIEMAKNATEQPVFKKNNSLEIINSFIDKMKKSGICAFINLSTDREFISMAIKYMSTCPKRIVIPNSIAEFFQLLFEQTTGSTKLMQIISCDKKIMAKIPFKSMREAITNSKSRCLFSRSIPEAQRTLDFAFKPGEYVIKKELSSASIGDVYIVKDKEGNEKVLKMLKNGLSKERLEVEEKLYLRLLKELTDTPDEYEKYKNVINSCYSDFISSLSFANEAANNKLLASGAKRYAVTPVIKVSDDGMCMIMEKAPGIQFDKLISLLKAYKENPKLFQSRYVDEISQNPCLANPQKVIECLPDTIIRTFDEQFMFLKKGAKSVMHGDPHPANLFISTDKKGRLIPVFIDSGSCIIRSEKQIIDDVRFFADYYLGNTMGIARHFVENCRGVKGDKNALIVKLSEEFNKRIFDRKKITDMKLVLENMNTILQQHGLKLPEENILAIKAQIQFYALAIEASELLGKPLNVITVIKDLPRAVIKLFIHGKNPISAMMPTIKHGVKNIDTAVGASYQFSIPKE